MHTYDRFMNITNLNITGYWAGCCIMFLYMATFTAGGNLLISG